MTMTQTKTQEIANELVEKCKQGKNLEVIDAHYAQDVVSVESMAAPDMPKEMKGLEQIKGKNQWWLENHEIHSAEVIGPFVNEQNNQFAVNFNYEVTFKPTGQRNKMTEMGLYTVKEGKIAHEHFYYNMDCSS